MIENRLVLHMDEGPTLVGTTYPNVALTVRGVYADGSLALEVVMCDDEGYPNPFDVVAMVTLSLNKSFPFDEIVIKNYSENEGIEEWLKAQTFPYLHDTGDTELIPWIRKIRDEYVGFVTAGRYRVVEGSPLYRLMKNGSEVFQNEQKVDAR